MKATLPFQKNHSRLHIANLTLLMALAFCTLLPSGQGRSNRRLLWEQRVLQVLIFQRMNGIVIP